MKKSSKRKVCLFEAVRNLGVCFIIVGKAHLDRGARMIYSEFKYSGDFVMALLNKDTTI